MLGEPTEQKLVLAHFGTLWLQLSTSGPFIHTAFSSGRLEENSIVRMRDVLERVLAWLPEWEEEMSYGDVRGVANVGAIQGGFGWRVSRTPIAPPLRRPAGAAGRGDGGRAASCARVRAHARGG